MDNQARLATKKMENNMLFPKKPKYVSKTNGKKKPKRVKTDASLGDFWKKHGSPSYQHAKRAERQKIAKRAKI